MKKTARFTAIVLVIAMLTACFAVVGNAASTNPGKTYLGVIAGDRGEGFKFYYSTAPKTENPLENRVALDMLITNKEPWPWPDGMNYYAEKADGTNAIVGMAKSMNGITLEANVNGDAIRRPMIAFTAPADGEYTYSMQSVRTLWNPGELGIEVWVGGVKNDSLYITVESGGTFTGTVHLKEGEELVFVTVNHAWDTASNTVLIQDLTVKYLGDEDTYRFDLSEGSLFTMYSHAHGAENSHLESTGENPYPANFASKGNSTTTYENGVLKLQWPAMTLVYFDAPECGKYQLDLAVTGLAGPDQTASCNIYFFVGNDTDGYVRVDTRLDPGYSIQRSISLTVNLAEDDYLVIGFGNYWGAELQVDNFTVDKIVGHTGGTATCKTKAVCENCGESYGDLDPANHESTENGYVSIDENNHKVTYACCGATKTESEGHNNGNDAVCDNCGYGCNHTGGTATCKTQAVCDTCGASYGELDPNNHEMDSFDYEDLGNGHKVTNECCGATVTASEDHDYIDGACDLCGHACTHTGGNATCENKAVCDDCGEEYGDTLAHNYVDGFCTECGDEDVSYVPPVSPDTGDMTVTAVILGAIALISLAYAGAKKRR